MVTYGYCKSSDTCLKDQWLYINRPCSSKWKNGKDVSFSSCKATLTSCHNFTSTVVSNGQWFNYTETLGVGEYCVVNVDAASYVGRVIIDDAVSVGVEYDGYDIGEVIDVKLGGSKNLILYNSDNSQATTFTLAYTQAFMVFNTFISVIALSSAITLLF